MIAGNRALRISAVYEVFSAIHSSLKWVDESKLSE